MLTTLNRSSIGFVKNLKHKKYRDEYGLFIIEGAKSVLEVLSNKCSIHTLLCTSDFLKKNTKAINSQFMEKTIILDPMRLSALGNFQSNNAAMAVCHKLDTKLDTNEPTLAIDSIRDPGNLGTIIRTAHWFGIRNIVCASDTVDLYNPKVLQACMGSFLQVNIVYTNLNNFLTTTNQPIFGAFTTGTNLYEVIIPQKSIIVIGNESHGISQEIEQLIRYRITIPRFSDKIDSLNVAVATGIVCGRWSTTNY